MKKQNQVHKFSHIIYNTSLETNLLSTPKKNFPSKLENLFTSQVHTNKN